jgi:hypothetical protein
MSAKRPRNTDAAKKREEVPPPHSIISELQAAGWRCGGSNDGQPCLTEKDSC